VRELFVRLLKRPGLATEMALASLFANVLALASPIFVIQVLNRYVAHGVDATLATLAAGVAIAIVLELAFRQIRLRLAGAISGPHDTNLAAAGFGSLTQAKIAALEQLPAGLKREMIGGTEKIQAAYAPANVTALFDVPFALLFIGVLYLLNAKLAMIVGGFVAFGFSVSVLTSASLRRPTRELQAASSRLVGLLGSTLSAGDTLRAFNGGDYLRDLWMRETEQFQKLARAIAQRQGFVQALGMSIQALMAAAVIAVGAMQVVAGTMDVGAMIGANILAARALGPIIRLAAMSETFAKARQATRVLREFAKLPMVRAQGTALADYKGTIEFQDLAFAHPGDKSPLFESVNLKLEPGSLLVFTGSNGSGKTTLARLCAGLLEPTRGRILVDDVDLAQVAPGWWRRQICYMPQEPTFVDGTIGENIRLANPALGDAAINDIVNRSGLRKFIDKSTGGLETPLVNQGANLSLGQRRRLALARALATAGQLLIIDEPTEGLDQEGAQHVLDVVNTMAGRGRTVMVFTDDPRILNSARHFVDLDAKPVPRLVRRAANEGTGAETEAEPQTGPEPDADAAARQQSALDAIAGNA
jgi:ATP-binding cassette subfamily C protein LapB